MRTKFHSIAPRILSLMAACVMCMTSCLTDNKDEEIPDPEVFEKVNILYSAGHNDLTGYLKDDINELAASATQCWNAPYDALIVFSHLAVSYKDFTPTEPKISRVKEKGGKIIYETLKTFPEETVSVNPDTFNEVLLYIKEHFPAKEYNLIFSSHGSGYLPQGYLGNSSKIEHDYGGNASQSYRTQKARHEAAYPAPADIPGPQTKGIGADYAGSSSNSYEMDITDFAAAIPMKLNAVIFDACFMGGVEVAYELKDKCNYLVASQSEILADGMVYTAMGQRIFGRVTDLQGLCEDYYDNYNTGSFTDNGGIISLADCRMLNNLAKVCLELFEKYRDAQSGTLPADYSQVQGFYRKGVGHYHGFYDLRDIMAKSGCSDEDLKKLDNAINECIVYKNATAGFITGYNGFWVSSHCGLSMYLPAHKGTNGNAYLDEYYKGLAWNKATGLVK